MDERWATTVRDAAQAGSVVYVLRHQSIVDFFALDHLTKLHALPEIRYAEDTGLFVLEPFGRAWLKGLFAARRRRPVREALEEVLAAGGSALLFLKRPPTLLEQGGVRRRGVSEGDEALRVLLELQRTRERPILLVPQTFVWSKRPDSLGGEALDPLFGPREWPGTIRTVGQLLANYRSADLRVSEPFDLRAFVAEHGSEPDATLVRKLTYGLLTRMERERRAILGPARKNPDRVRDEIIRSPKLTALVRDLAGEGKEQQFLLRAKAYGMLRELEARPTLEVHTAFEAVLEQIVHRIYAGIELDEDGLERVREAARAGAVVFLPSHKSHVDYLMLSYVLNQAHITLPLIAAGDNLAFFPMGPIFRRGGAFFIRRSFKGDRLYAAVVDAYLRRLVKDGHAIEFFLEGGRSRTGKLLPPKVGLLSMVVDAALSTPDRRVTFIPVSIGYDRIVEERSYVRELGGGEKTKEDASAMLRGARVLSGFYGRVNVQFGEPLTIAGTRAALGYKDAGALTPAQRRGLVTRLAHQVMGEINRVTSVTPGAVVALLLLDRRRRGVAHAELVEAARRVVATLARAGARLGRSLVTPSGALRPEAIREATRLWMKGELVVAHAVVGHDLSAEQKDRAAIYTGDDVVYSVPEEKRVALSLSKNIIVHFFVSQALVSIGLLVHPTGGAVPLEALRERVQALSRLFKFEFMFRADASFEALFHQTLAEMQARGELVRDEADGLSLAAGHDGWSGEAWVRFYAEVVTPYLAGYVVAARAIQSLLRGSLAQKDLVKKALAMGTRMFLEGEIQHPEGVSRPILENALEALRDQGYLVLENGKLSLSPSFASADTAKAVEARIAGWLVRRQPE